MSDQPHFSEPHRPQWKTRMGFILAGLGSAVGLGNIWRFSYLCYKNGGGAFLIPYGIALFVVGLPLMILELGIGHRMRGAAPMSLAKTSRNWEWLGWWSVIVAMYGIMLYYSVVIAWCVSFVFFSVNLSWGADPNAFFFQDFLQMSGGPTEIGNIRGPVVLSMMAVWFISWLVVFFGVQKGIERANRIFMPLLVVLIGIMVAWSLTLEGAMEGIKVYLTPDFSLLGKWQTWAEAFSQIFFTLSLGFGIMITYASYLPRKADVVQDACVISLGNCLFSFIAGFAVFGTLGYMSVTSGTPISEIATEAIALCFVTYPKIISTLPGAASNIFGLIFFTTLVVAGLSSAVSLVEAFSSAVIDKFHYKRENVVSTVCVTGFLGSFIFTAQSGIHWLDIVDHFITQYGLVIGGLLECVLIGWIFRSQKLRQHINQSGKIRLTRLWDVSVRFVTPVILAVLLAVGFYNDVFNPDTAPYSGYSWVAIIMIGRDWLMVALIAALIVAMRPWREEHRLKDMPHPEHKT